MLKIQGQSHPSPLTEFIDHSVIHLCVILYRKMAHQINSRVLKTEPIEWRKLSFLQDDTFKDLSAADKAKLKSSVTSNDFSQPFYVWQDSSDGTVYCLDGKHRSMILAELAAEGVAVPDELPATFISCSSKKEAAELVLQYSSSYAKITETGLLDFMEAFSLSIDEVSLTVNFPDFDMQSMIGETDRDFSERNKEFDAGEFADEITLKLVYTREEYIPLKGRINELCSQKGLANPESLIKHLIFDAQV